MRDSPMNVIISPSNCAMSTAPDCAASPFRPCSDPSDLTSHAPRTGDSCFAKVKARAKQVVPLDGGGREILLTPANGSDAAGAAAIQLPN